MGKIKTIKEVVKNKLCNGCGTCASLCPCNAIKMVLDTEKGLYCPELNQEKCKRCGLCFEVCPGHAMGFAEVTQKIFGKVYEHPIGYHLNCYTGYANNKIRYNSTSGGLVTTILCDAFEQGIIDGAIVTRMKAERPLEPEPFIARNKEDIIESSGSKYCPVSTNTALAELLEAEGRYAVVGLPCHIHGLRKAELTNKKLRERVVLCLGLFCGYTRTFKGTEYLLNKMAIKMNEVISINYRGEGWPGKLTIKLTNGKQIQKPYPNNYNTNFGSFIPWRCTLCPDRTAELADISFGDAWLPDLIKTNNTGVSVAITRSNYGENIIKNAAKRGIITLFSIDKKTAYKTQGGDTKNKARSADACMKISKIFGKKLPNFDIKLPSSNPMLSIRYLIIYTCMFFAKKRYLWWILDNFCLLIKYSGKIKMAILRKNCFFNLDEAS